jgi:hypothetical protein
MDESLKQLVWRRARSRCEYCQLAQELVSAPFEIDHVIALKHRGRTIASNLALACFHCNNHKGPNIAGIDPVTRAIVRLFHPRRHRWQWHFVWDGPELVGRTSIGRTTIAVLEINLPLRVLQREALREEGVFPPA